MNKHKLISFQTAYSNLLMFLYGISVVMIGTVLPEFIKQYSLTMSEGGLVVTVQSLGGLSMVFAGIVLADRVPKSLVIVISFIVLGAFRLLTAAAASYPVLLVVFFCSGLALRNLDTMLNAFIGDIHKERRGFYMNILHLFFSLGAFVGPSLARFLLNAGTGWRSIYILIGLIYLGVGIPGFALMRKDGIDAHSSQVEKRRTPGAGHVIKLEMLLLGLSLLLYAVHQSGITAWLPHYMNTELHAGVNLSSYALSLYWVGIILSRLIASRISTRVAPSVLVTIGTIITGTYLTVGFFALKHPVSAVVLLGIAGAMTGAVIPLSMVIAHDWHPEKTGSSTAYLTFYLLAGHLLSPALIGLVGDSKGLSGAMLITSISLVCCSVASLYARKVHLSRAS